MFARCRDILVLRTLKIDICCFMEFASTGPLTLANLALPQFQAQDTCRVELFVRSQRLYSSTFASGGHVFDKSHSCDMRSSEKPAPLSTRIQGVGFSSPVLKARVDKIRDAAAASVLADESSKASDDCETAKRTINTVGKRDLPTRRAGKDSKKISTNRSRTAAKHSSEHAARKEF